MRFLARRLAHAVLLLLAVSFLSFALLQFTPGDFFDGLRLNPEISPQTIEGLRAQYGLDRPLPVRYERWVAALMHGQLGFSLAYKSPVGPLLRDRARNTLLLTGTATLLSWLIAIPIGIWSAATKGKWPDRVSGIATSTLLTVPDLLLFLLLLLLAVRTGWFPAGGMVSAAADANAGFWAIALDIARHLVLPAAGLALVALPTLVRHIRSSMIDVLASPFIRAARAHGISRMRILFRYALPVAANPLISLFGLSIAGMLSASALAEVVLSWPGLGPLLLESVLARDVYVVAGTVMVAAVFLIVGNFLADLILFAVDPRIRVQS
ncbi:MAG: ABC transporter permease [Candidatus Acidiferrales bacterium]